MNQTIQDLMTRRSVRAYTDRMPSKQDIETICQAGLYAATGMGTQSPIILAVTNKAMRDRMSNAKDKPAKYHPRFRIMETMIRH